MIIHAPDGVLINYPCYPRANRCRECLGPGQVFVVYGDGRCPLCAYFCEECFPHKDLLVEAMLEQMG